MGARIGLLGVALAVTLSGCGSSGGDVATATGDSMPGMPGMSAASMGQMNMAAYDGDGLRSTVDGYSLVGLSGPKKAGQAGTLSFVINGPAGQPQTDFTLQQTKLLHLYVVRADLTDFQHIHPTLDPKSGEWSVPVTFARPGPYRVVAEFEALRPDGNFDDRILGADLRVPGAYHPVGYTPTYGGASVAGYRLTLDPTALVHGPDLHLRITRAGAGVTDLQQYLQSYAHITGFRQGDLKAVHVHPNETPPKTDPNAVGGPVLTLASLFSVPGNYRLFVEFRTAGVLHQAPIDVKVG
jgi:hypothetical protein